MEVKSYDCRTCGEVLNFADETRAICQICGTENELVKQEALNQEAVKELEQTFGSKLDDLERRFQISGDVEARDYLFKRDQQPRLDIHFESLIEKYEEYFRRPLIQLKLLKKYNSLFNTEKVFKIETKKGYSEEFTHELIQFGKRQLNHPIMELLAAKKETKNHIKILKHHSLFLSNLFNIRGMALKINESSLGFVENLINRALIDCQELIPLYDEINKLNSIKFQTWETRLKLNLNIVKILQACISGQYSQVEGDINKELIYIEKTIQDYKDKNNQDENLYPLFFILIVNEGFTMDKRILQFLQKIIDFLIESNIQIDFINFLVQLESLLDIADTPFNETKFPSSDWDPNWINSLEESFERLSQILDNLATNLKITQGKEPVFVLDVDKELFDAWEPNQIIEGKSLPSAHFSMKNSFQIKHKVPIYIPIAIMSTYAILKTGFIRKGGDEFESFLLVNPFFRFDKTVNKFSYAKAFGYIDIAETLKEKNPLKNQLSDLENLIESGSKTLLDSSRIVLPILVTQKEIEEFVQKTYDLFEIVREGENPIPKFTSIYKNVGIAKKVEKLSGELIDFLYVPALFLNISSGTLKKGNFVAKEDYKWKILLPLNNNPQDPWNSFIRMIFNPDSLINIGLEIQKFGTKQLIPQHPAP
ncbi:hypothetical protein LCGC14_1046810 [marine sediment metagenome]|uniref:Uncharacterized protein n=1 Tax=marine sediment metagenome TaxID=412755 RepID=A0A0F9MUI2_9ZZZZ|nr:hypothetical protein [bacterium]